MSESILIADHLCVDRGGQRVLEDVSFSISRGEVFALLGSNGAGKSTTLLTFLGFIPPASGEARVNGLNIQENEQEIRRQTAYLPESVNLYPHLTGRENLNYFLSLAGVDRSEDEIEGVLENVSLATGARGDRLATYSKGMRQKVTIALAILRKAPVLLLDEPTSGLDPIAIDEFNDMLGMLSQGGTTVFMVTHDVYGACLVAQRVGLLQQGRLVGMFEATAGGQISAEEVHRQFAEHRS